MFNERMSAHSPANVVKTARMILTPISADSVDELLLLHRDPAIDEWTGPWSETTTEAWAKDMAKRWADDGVGKWLAHDRFDGSLVGRGGFTLFAVDGEAVLELGWAVRGHLTGQGYATEIGRAATRWAATFSQLPIVSFTEVHNVASRAVMSRLGMRYTGVIHRTGLVEGRLGLHPDAPFALYRYPVDADR